MELIKKLKALAERGVEGEAINANKMLQKMLQKHNLTIEEIEGEKQQDYFFKANGLNATLFHQIVKRVNYNLKLYQIPAKKVKQFMLEGNQMVTCTVAEFIEIDQMFDVYKKLYKKESELFYTAFYQQTTFLLDLQKKTKYLTNDLTPAELEEWMRVQQMATKIKTETIRKQLSKGTLSAASS